MKTKKSDIAENLYKELALSKRECGDIVDRFFEIIKKSLADGGEVKLPEFGVFEVRHKKARIGRNPRTREEAVITERKVVTFRLSLVLKNAINRENMRT